MKKVSELLEAAYEDGSKNRLLPEDVRAWIDEYLDSYEEDLGRFPEERGKSHWDILAADYDQGKDAMFLVAFFRGEAVSFISGRGRIPDVRGFGLNSFPDDPDRILIESRRRFSIADEVTLDRSKLSDWLNG